MNRIWIVGMALLLGIVNVGCTEQSEPDPGDLQTPQYSIGQSSVPETPKNEEFHTAQDGIKRIPAEQVETTGEAVETDLKAVPVPVTPETVWQEDRVVTYNAFTQPDKVAFDDGSIGVLSIGKVGLTVNVYESDDQMEDMKKGASHFKSTTCWDGNIGISAHNATPSGYGAYFKDLHLLAVGDNITYKTTLGERSYTVTSIKTIGDEDWSYLSRSAQNQITLITCVNNNGAKRLMVRAEEDLRQNAR